MKTPPLSDLEIADRLLDIVERHGSLSHPNAMRLALEEYVPTLRAELFAEPVAELHRS